MDTQKQGATATSILHNDIYVNPDAAIIGDLAHESAEAEILTSPKPGLVDAHGSGCHDDMDCAAFLASTDALRPYWRVQAAIGLSGASPAEAAVRLRAAGLEAERAMFAATGGVNTHKGLIYLLSLLVYGAGRALLNGEHSAEAAALRASEAAAGAVERELLPLKSGRPARSLTHGELLYARYGITGARGEAENGFPSVIRHGLPEYERALAAGAADNGAMISALLAIMEHNEDSNVIHRGGYEYWAGEYKALVREARRSFAAPYSDYGPVIRLERSFMERRISPGGAADLLTCTKFLRLFRQKYL